MKSFLLAATLLLFACNVKADLLGSLAGDTIDDTISRIDSMLAQYSDKLIGKSDEYITRLENLVANTMTEGFEQTEALRRRAMDDLRKLEKEVMDDLQRLVFESECAALRVAKDAPKEAIETTIRSIKEQNPSLDVKLFNKWTLFSVGPEAAADPDGIYSINPDISYYQFRNDVLGDLDKKYNRRRGSSLPAYPFYTTLISLSALARQTACFFPGAISAERRFLTEHASMAAKAAVWDDIVSVRYSQ